MIRKVLSEVTASISELQQNPMSVLKSGEGEPVAVLNHNQVAFYCIPAETYEAMLDELEDMRLAALVAERESDPNRELVEVEIDNGRPVEVRRYRADTQMPLQRLRGSVVDYQDPMEPSTSKKNS